jgi:hypothetical protein
MLVFPIGLESCCVIPFGIKGQGACGAFRYTGRRFSAIDSLSAERALPHGVLRRTELRYVKRTRLDAVTAPNAPPTQVVHDSICPLPKGTRRTGGDAGRIAAMKACGGDGMRLAAGIGAGNVSLDPAEQNAGRRIILQLTGNLAGVARNAFL